MPSFLMAFMRSVPNALAHCQCVRRDRLRRCALLMVATLMSAHSYAAWGANAQTLIDRVLIKANAAFKAQRYTQPQYNNAYDRYNAVLMIAPNNAEAKQGLRLILQRYIALANGELDSGSAKHAVSFLLLIDEYYGQPLAAAASGTDNNFGLVLDDAKAVQAVRARLAAHKQVKPSQDFNDLRVKSYRLDPAALKAKGSAIREDLAQIAARLARSHESVLIYARNDTEGRWIYQALNAATPDFRVRGDIRLAKQPSIDLLEPF